jgi:Leucine-rich repeat (LRR) protein
MLRIENFDMYKKMQNVTNCHDTIVKEIVDYGLKYGINFLSEEWSKTIKNIDVDFSTIEKHTHLIEYLGIVEVEKSFAQNVFTDLIFNKNLCFCTDAEDEYKINFLCRHGIFYENLVDWNKKVYSLENKQCNVSQTYGSMITNKYLSFLYKNLEITELNISGNLFVTDEGIKHLINLKKINICGTKITDEGIKDLKNLRELHINDGFYNLVTNNGIKDLKKLEKLCIAHSLITEEGVKNLEELKFLSIHHTRIGDGVKCLKKIEVLHAEYSHVTDDGIKDLTELKRLSVGGIKITDNGVKNLTKLEYLYEHNTLLTRIGVRHLKKNGCVIMSH